MFFSQRTVFFKDFNMFNPGYSSIFTGCISLAQKRFLLLIQPTVEKVKVQNAERQNKSLESSLMIMSYKT